MLKGWQLGIICGSFILFWISGAEISSCIVSCCIILICLFIENSITKPSQELSLNVPPVPHCNCQEDLETIKNEFSEKVKELQEELEETTKSFHEQLKVQHESLVALINNTHSSCDDDIQDVVSTEEDLVLPVVRKSSTVPTQIKHTQDILESLKGLQNSIRSEDPVEAINEISKELELLTCGLDVSKNILDDNEDIQHLDDISSSSSDDESSFLTEDEIQEIENEDKELRIQYGFNEPIINYVPSVSESNNNPIEIETKEEDDDFDIEETKEESIEENDKEEIEKKLEEEEKLEDKFLMPSEPIEIKTRKRSSTVDTKSPDKAPVWNYKVSNSKKTENSSRMSLAITGSPRRGHLLQASHRSPTNTKELLLDKETREKLNLLDKAGLSGIKSSNTLDMRQTLNLKRHASSIGLNSSRALISRKSRLMFNLDVKLPYGGITQIECFQDAPQSEILDMLWTKLMLTPQQKPTSSASAFVAVTDLIFLPDFSLMDALISSVNPSSKEHVVQLFIQLTITQKQSVEFVKKAIDIEVEDVRGSINSLFRGNSFTTVLIATFFRYHLHTFLVDRLSNLIHLSLQHPIFEDSSEDPETETAKEHAIIDLATKIFDIVESSVIEFPDVMKGICSYISQTVSSKYPGQELKVMAGFLFLRLLCPLLLSGTSEFGVKDELKRYLVKITKYLQMIANHVVQQECLEYAKLEKYQEKAVQLFQHFSENNYPCEEFDNPELLALSGISTRDTVTKLYKLIVDNLRNIMLHIHNEMNEKSEDLIQSLIKVAGYPLGDKKEYYIKVTNSDYYFTSGLFRPLVDCPSLQKYFTKCDLIGNPSFSLVEKKESRNSKRTALQIGCLLDNTTLPSWRFDSPEVNLFRDNIIHPLHESIIYKKPLAARILPYSNDLQSKTFLIRISLPNDIKKSLYISPEQNITDLMHQTFQKAKTLNVQNLLPQENYIFRIAERERYLLENIELGRYMYISECLTRRKPIELMLVEKKTVPGLLHETPPSPKSQKTIDTNDIISFDVLSDPLVSIVDLNESIMIRSSSNPNFIPLYDGIEKHEKYSITVLCVEDFTIETHCPKGSDNSFGFLQAEMYHNGKRIANTVRSAPAPLEALEWEETLEFDISTRNIPLTTRICFTLFSIHHKNESKIPLGWVATRVYDFQHCLLRNKNVELGFWMDETANPIGTCIPSYDIGAPKLIFSFKKYPHKFIQIPRIEPRRKPLLMPSDISIVTEEQKIQLHRLINKDPLYQPTKDELKLLWNAREHYKNIPGGLYKFLLSVSWTNFFLVQEAYRLLEEWAPPTNPTDVLELLGVYHEDERVRQYAVNHISVLSDSELESYILQLVQVLKHEKDHCSALSLFLLSRAIQSPLIIGQKLFWTIFAEIDSPLVSERFGLILEAFLRSLGEYRNYFMQQKEFILVCNSLADGCLAEKSKQARNEALSKLLLSSKFPSKFPIPYEPS